MNFNDPVWNLNQLCPVCGQGSCLSFYTCQQCKKIVLFCVEEGSLFPNPKDLTQVKIEVEECPSCAEKDAWEFSTSGEIRALGFKVGEYC